jgi:tetratricopeptide (TPR) repeat protein
MADSASGSKPSAADAQPTGSGNSSPGKRQELAALEQAFAQDPASAAYRPLAEAYLNLQRFMEAMIVAKKGAKARPSESAPRVLLARIYAVQNKDPKALEELSAALQIQPQDLEALKLQARLLYKGGQSAAGAEALRKALAVGPADPEVLELGAKFGVSAAPPPATAPQAPAPAPSAMSHPGPAVVGQLPAIPKSARIATPLDASGQPMVRAAPRPTMAMQALAAEGLARLADEEELRASQKRRSGPRLLLTVALTVVGVLGLLVWYGYGKYRNQRDHEIAALLKKTQEALANDSYASYQQAEKTAQRALELDPSNYAADAYLAYINALRFGENGEGEDYLKRAQDYLAAAKAARQPHAYIVAADAYILFFTHRAPDAEAELIDILDRKDATGNRLYSSNLLSGALGIIRLQQGKLGDARKSLVEAHNLASADVRVTAALGTVDARLGFPNTAEAFFQQALKVDADHVPSLLGLAQLEIESEPPNSSAAEKTLAHLAALGPGALSPRQSAYARFMHAQLLYAENKAGPAADEEKTAFALDPTNAEMLVVAGRRLRRAGQPDKAIALVKQAIELDPNRGTFYAELGEAYLAVPNGAANAVQQLTQAVSRVAPNARLLSLLAEAYHRAGDGEHAQEQWEKALKIDPDNGEAHLGLARLFLQKGNLARARSEYELLARHAQGAVLAEAQTELGRAALERGDPNRARELFTSAIGASANYAPPYFYVGRLLLEDRSKKPQAKLLLANYLKLSPEGPLAAEAKKLMK